MNATDQQYQEFESSRKTFWETQVNDQRSNAATFYHQALTLEYQNLIPQGAKVLELGCGAGDLLAALKSSHGVGVDFSKSAIDKAKVTYPQLIFYEQDVHHLELEQEQYDYIVISELINDLWDVQTFLQQLLPHCHSSTRVMINFYSHLWQFPMYLARKLGLATPVMLQNWFTPQDVDNVMQIAGFEPLKSWQSVLVPVNIPLMTPLANRYLAKTFPFNHCCLTNLMVARPIPRLEEKKYTVSVIVAARNEAGHIDELIARIPQMGSGTEIIFVEGNSTDDTYAVIEEKIQNQPNYRLLKQAGKGKGDAVRAGFEAATGDILMILDADITVPPEDLNKFYHIIANRTGEFINGVRLVYPMQDEAMRFFNFLGNKFFSWAFSYLLGQPIRDTLCGTKVLWKKDYARIAKGRTYFGDFDPFGDFDLLFGAARLHLKIVEVPIRYRARRYGETNISRWSHGWLLLKMVMFAARRIKFI